VERIARVADIATAGCVLMPYARMPVGVPNDVEASAVQLEGGGERLCPVFVREHMLDLFREMDKASGPMSTVDGAWPRTCRKIIKGPFGAGKSTSLFLAARRAMDLGWLVIFIPFASEMKTELAEQEVAQNILRAARVQLEAVTAMAQHQPDPRQHEYPPLSPAIVTDEHFERLRQLAACVDPSRSAAVTLVQFIGCARQLTAVPVLVAVDQWNAVHRVQSPLCAYLSEFSSFIVRRGAVLFAVSSSFECQYVLRDGDAMNAAFFLRIPAFDRSEFSVLLRMYQSGNLWPEHMPEAQAFELTGGLGRLARVLYTHYRSEAGDPLADFVLQAKAAYCARMASVLRRHQPAHGTDVERTGFSRIVANAVRLVCNRGVPEAELAQIWQESGMLTLDDTDPHRKYYVAAPAVASALGDLLAGRVEEHLQVLAADADTRWRAFELLVHRALQQSAIDLPCRRVDGTLDTSQQSLAIRCTGKTVLQERPAPCYTDPLTLAWPPDTLVVCHARHSVVDFVAHTAAGHIVFVQVSEQCYSRHAAKLDDLFSTELSVRRARGGPREVVSVYAYYMEAFGRTYRRNARSLPADVHYVYVTPCGTLCRVTQENRAVRLWSGPDLDLLGQHWPGIRSKFP
jgi:hypothetical protein